MKRQKPFAFLAATGMALASSLVCAQTLTSVPMQGSMVMPMVAYSAADGALHVQVDPAVPQLTPLLASNPGAGFAPADPWFECLDPSRRGLAFSRRYGFVMNAATDPLPAGTSIWLRRISGSPQLELYRYRSTDPKAWEPIFGTAGATNAMLWNATMFHPGVAAPAGTNSYSATFDAVLRDNASGAEIAGSGSAPFVLNWTSIEDGRPTLNAGLRVVIAWPASATNWVLEAADALSPTNWAAVTNAPVILEGQMSVVAPTNCSRMFYRMRPAP